MGPRIREDAEGREMARLAVYNAASLGFADWSILIGGIHSEAKD